MTENKVILSSDSVNKYNFRIDVEALEDALDKNYSRGFPTYIGHDAHRLIGWTIPFGLYIEPGMTRFVGRQMIATTQQDQEFINKIQEISLTKKNEESCAPHIEELKSMVNKHLTEDAYYIDAGCVCYQDLNIAEKLFPLLFEKQDKDGLIYITDLLEQFTYRGLGVFTDKNSGLALLAHQYFRKSLSTLNNLNSFFIDELLKQAKADNVNVRIAIDRNKVGLSRTFRQWGELEYVRGPKFNDDISSIKPGVTVYGNDNTQKSYNDIIQTEFWWKHETQKQTLEAEEVKNNPSYGIDDNNYGCRYIHSIFDENTDTFEHFDGAIRMYDTEMMLERMGKDIKSAGKNSYYTKLFRIDGQLPINKWKTLVCYYFQGNQFVHEYFEITPEEKPQIEKINKIKNLDILTPYSMNEGDGVRLLVSYHPIENKQDEIRVVSNYDTYSDDEGKIKVIENDIIEIKKALNRLQADIIIDNSLQLIHSDDLYWNIPTISHKSCDSLENNISTTLQAIQNIFEGIVSKEKNKVASFTISWEENNEKTVSVSIMGHCSDILSWLRENKTIPIKKSDFKIWVKKQSILINKYKIQKDYPALFNIVRTNGVLYIMRTPLDRSKFKFEKNGSIGLKLYFNKDQSEIADACQNGKISLARLLLIEKSQCTLCNQDYKLCPHSKYMDEMVTENVTSAVLLAYVWTDRIHQHIIR